MDNCFYLFTFKMIMTVIFDKQYFGLLCKTGTLCKQDVQSEKTKYHCLGIDDTCFGKHPELKCFFFFTLQRHLKCIIFSVLLLVIIVTKLRANKAEFFNRDSFL